MNKDMRRSGNQQHTARISISKLISDILLFLSQIFRHMVGMWLRRLRASDFSAPFDIASAAGISVLIVGLMTSKYRELVEPQMRMKLISALLTLLNGPPAQQALGAELLAMGFSVWKVSL
jgi:hypothetical protein